MVPFLLLITSIFTFHMVNSTFYFCMVKLTFYLVKSTFDMVNFLLLISVREKHRLQTGGEVQTECKMQTEDCRPDQG